MAFDLRDFVEFEGRWRSYASNTPRIGVQRRGSMSLNRAAFKALGEPTHVVFLTIQRPVRSPSDRRPATSSTPILCESNKPQSRTSWAQRRSYSPLNSRSGNTFYGRTCLPKVVSCFSRNRSDEGYGESSRRRADSRYAERRRGDEDDRHQLPPGRRPLTAHRGARPGCRHRHDRLALPRYGQRHRRRAPTVCGAPRPMPDHKELLGL